MVVELGPKNVKGEVLPYCLDQKYLISQDQKINKGSSHDHGDIFYSII